MEAISVIAKVISIMLLLVAVQAQESFPSDYPSLLSESEFLDDVPSQTQQSPFLTEEQTYLPSAFETQSHLDVNSLISSESEFPEDSEDTVRPLPIHHPIFHSPPPPSETPSTPEAPSPKISPSSPLRPSIPKTCKPKCAAMCMEKRRPVLHGLCIKFCRRRCVLHYSQLIYDCTNQCAEAMPKIFKSDPKKTASYVDHCYLKCIKKQ